MTKRLQYILPGLAQCWVIVFFLIAIGGLGVGTLLSILCNTMGYDMRSLNPLVSYIIPIIPAFAYLFFTKERAAAPVAIEKPNLGKTTPFIVYPLLAVATIALGYVSEPLSSWLPMPDSIKQIFEKILNDSFWAFITTVIAAPLVEEFLLRGIIERGLLKNTTPTNAIVWSSFFFALIHLNPWQAIGAFIFGAFLGWIYWRTHSLVACIFIHAINNGTAYFIQLLNPNLLPDSSYKDLLGSFSDNIYWIVFVIFAVSLALILYYLDKRLPKDNF